MPQQSKYATQALRQAAYRQRTRRSQDELLSQRGLPTGPAIPSMPGTARWNEAAQRSKALLETVIKEMRDYYDDRSETWQEGPQGEAFTERMESLQELGELYSTTVG